jgi:hypothetical protein
VANDEERRFRLRPRKPAARTERRALASAYKTIMHYARMTSLSRRSGGQTARRARPHFQRCAVRVTYAKNSTRGQWRAHGRDVARESATHEGDLRKVGFNATEESIDIAARLEGWQKTNDEQLWKLIVSPECGDRVDLKRLTRDLIHRWRPISARVSNGRRPISIPSSMFMLRCEG